MKVFRRIIRAFRRIIKAFTFIWRHPLVQNERFSAFYRYIKFHIVNRNGQECIIPFLEHSLLFKKGEGSQGHYYTYLEDFEEMLFLLHFLDMDDRFIDIGANIGSYSILASTNIGCHTLSFEPSVENYKILNSNVQLNNVQSTIKLYNYALGDKNESKTIGFKGAMTYITNNKRLNLQRTVIKKLDNIVAYANLLKVDVEGYEEFVLKGAKGVLSHPKTNAIIIELAGYNRYGSSNEKVHNLLIQHNFFPIKYFPYERVFNRLKTYRKNQFNTIYIRDEKFVENRLINSPKYKIGNQYI